MQALSLREVRTQLDARMLPASGSRPDLEDRLIQALAREAVSDADAKERGGRTVLDVLVVYRL